MGRFSDIETPVPGPECFQRSDPAAVASQASQLLGMSARLSGDPRFLPVGPITDTTNINLDSQAIGELGELRVPQLEPTTRRTIGQDLQLGDYREIVLRAYSQPTLYSAMALCRTCLDHQEPLVRAAAAYAWFRHGDDPRASLDTLAASLDDEEELVRHLAATALARIRPEDTALQRLVEPEPSQTGGATRTATLVHGTFARDAAWWPPGGSFHTYLQANVRNDMYAGPDPFSWSGGYSDSARAIGATELARWVSNHVPHDLDVAAHSHGGSVAMASGALLKSLVLLSCPAHELKYAPDFKVVQRVCHVRVRFDLVVLVDGGNFRFRNPKIQDVQLPIWFDHSASHDPDVWSTYKVSKRVGW